MTQRVITGLILLGIGIVVITFGGWAMLGWVFLLALLTTYELFAMLKKAGIRPYALAGYIAVGSAILATYFDAHLLIWTHGVTRAVVLGLLGVATLELLRHRVWIPKSRLLATLRVVVFVVATFTSIFLLREGYNGLINFIFCILIVWSTDTFALFGGKWLGRTPLSSISPKKTVEGSLIGLMAGVAVSWAYLTIIHHVWGIQLNLWGYLALAIILGVISQIGDLHESLVKRHFGVKDSSNLLPGHGGVYDRADSTLFVAPIAFYFFN